MTIRLIQYLNEDGQRRVGLVKNREAFELQGAASTLELARSAWKSNRRLADLAAGGTGRPIDYDKIIAEKRILNPVDHPEPARLKVSGTGLTHLGSAEARDRMHQKIADAEEVALTDSMRMFKWGLEGGKPAGSGPGVQPEWFYKGDGDMVVPPEESLARPYFALDGGEEPEIVGVYWIADDGSPQRLGYAIGNEFSDHETERRNYLYLAHSKLRPCSFGPELLLGDLPRNLVGTSRIVRDGGTAWEKTFLSGEGNMCHSLANLEYHHFKYDQHRRPGDMHVHFLGTATLSFSDGFTPQPGDVFEIEIPEFGRPLRNPLVWKKPGPVDLVAAL